MDETDFLKLHADCVTAMRAYFVEAEKTSGMLAKCNSRPLSFAERMGLLSQEVIEHDAHRLYLTSKRFLYPAALLGYGFTN